MTTRRSSSYPAHNPPASRGRKPIKHTPAVVAFFKEQRDICIQASKLEIELHNVKHRARGQKNFPQMLPSHIPEIQDHPLFKGKYMPHQGKRECARRVKGLINLGERALAKLIIPNFATRTA